MHGKNTFIPGNNYPPHYPGSLEQEFRRLQTALMGLTNELSQTTELIQSIKEYIDKRHTIYFPLHESSGSPEKAVCR